MKAFLSIDFVEKKVKGKSMLASGGIAKISPLSGQATLQENSDNLDKWQKSRIQSSTETCATRLEVSVTL